MYSSFQLALRYISYYFTAGSGMGHGIHSPFVFDFITKVLNDRTDYADYKKVESLRKRSLADRTILTIDDYGAGSSSSSSKKRSVSSIARHALKSKKYAQLLYRIVKYYQPNSVLELGTSLGITTCYLSLARRQGKVFTLEGSSEIAKVARQHFSALTMRGQNGSPEVPAIQKRINLIEGNFDYTLPSVLYQVTTVDFAFIDGNHRRVPTENYFHWLIEKVNPNSIFVFDDIHWSKEMEQAWKHIKEHPAVRCSLDLFFIGIVFFRSEFREKQHFTIRF